ncbi:MAG: DUF4249 family protein [Flavobacteriales bacterium]
MRSIIPFISVAILALSTTGCQEEIDLDLPANDAELVVEGYLTQRDYFIPEGDLDCFGQTTIAHDFIEIAVAAVDAFINIDSIESQTDYFPFNKVRLTSTADYFANSAPPAVSGAVVRLFEDGTLVETLSEDASEAGIYRITHLPKVGSSYYLEIEALGNFYETTPEVYQSVPPLISVDANYGPNFIQDSCAFYMGVQTYEKPGTGDHYRWFFYRDNEYDDRPGFIATSNDDGIDAFCLFGLDVYGDELELGDTLITFQMITTEGYFNFINSVRNQTAFVGSPFDAPPAPIQGNVKNVTKGTAAFGYFAAGGISANAAIVPEVRPDEDCLQ